MPRCLGSGVNPSVVGPQGPRGNIVHGWLLSGYSVINVTNGLLPRFRRPDRVRRCGGSEIIPCASCMYILYQSLSPSLPGGRLGGPPEAAGVPLPLKEAGPPLWRGVDDFPLCLGAAVVPLWSEVGGCPPWLGVGSCLLSLGAG